LQNINILKAIKIAIEKDCDETITNEKKMTEVFKKIFSVFRKNLNVSNFLQFVYDPLINNEFDFPTILHHLTNNAVEAPEKKGNRARVVCA
jgi:hypothetical protein